MTIKAAVNCCQEKNKTCLTTLVVSVVASQQQTPNAARSFRIICRACRRPNRSRPFRRGRSNLAVFLAIARGVKVRELGLGTQVIKADLFPGDLGRETHGRADILSLVTLRYRSTRSYRIASLPSYWLPIIRAKSSKFTKSNSRLMLSIAYEASAAAPAAPVGWITRL